MDRLAQTVNTSKDCLAQTVNTSKDRIAQTVNTSQDCLAQTVNTSSHSQGFVRMLQVFPVDKAARFVVCCVAYKSGDRPHTIAVMQ